MCMGCLLGGKFEMAMSGRTKIGRSMKSDRQERVLEEGIDDMSKDRRVGEV